MGEIKLRSYQERAVSEVREALAKYRRVLFCAPCGMGKTICFSYIAKESQKYNRKVLIVSNRSEILMQNGGALQGFGLDVDYISPKHRQVPTKNVAVGMAQTLKRRIESEEWLAYLREVNILITDECHCCEMDFLYSLVREDAWVLGASATPARRSHQAQLGDFFRALVVSVTVKELQDEGYLSRSHHYSIIAPSLDGLNIDSGTGDYNRKQLAQRFESKKLYTGIVKEYMRLTPHKKAICFCVSAEQAIAITEEFNRNGVSARYVLSGDYDSDSMYSGKREQVFEDFHNNKFEVLVNISICTAGYDEKDIEVVILNFATVSLSRYLQATGRGSRITDTKRDFVVLDAGRNYDKFGVYEAERVFSLWHDDHKSVGVMAMKICDTEKRDCNGRVGCGCMLPVTMKVCKNCGYVFRTQEYEYELYLEEVQNNSENGSIEGFVASKRKDGWNMNRIMVAVCLRNAGNEKKAFVQAYCALNPTKSADDARKYWFIFDKNVWSKVKKRKKSENSAELFAN